MKRRRRLVSDLDRIRTRTLGLIEHLDDDDLHRQFNRIMSPVVWDVGHIGNFEELWLLRVVDGRPVHDPALDRLYNPFENPRWVRGELPILQRGEALDYLTEVRGEAMAIMGRRSFQTDDPLLRDGYVYDMVVQHEAQHQETVLQALDLRDDLSPYGPAKDRRLAAERRVDDEERIAISGGPFTLGTDDRRSAYDNERPLHLVDLPTFSIDRFPTTVRRYARFVKAGGYRRPELWSDPGWSWVQETGHEAPQGWIPDLEGGWLIRRFGHIRRLDPTEPVMHVSLHEAEAFARWAGGRLPTEAEWEKAAAWDPAAGRSRRYPWGQSEPTPELANLDHAGWGPAPVGSYPLGASAYGVEQLLGDVYEWTSSKFKPYPGYSTFPYPEYSEVFFGEDYTVLRGASWATSRLVARNTFRNWDYPIRRQIFSGIRLAWDAA
jgi:iron(II)-dependent oxidoreductase